MNKIKSHPSFSDHTKELCVVVTVTNWNEPPRIRHEITNQLARKYNVLYIQLYQKKGIIRTVKKINDSLIIDNAGFGFPGIGRLFKYLPILKRLYNKFVSNQIEDKLKLFNNSKSSILINFQYDFPEINEIKFFKKKIYFCNDDFVSQDISSSKAEVKRKYVAQSRVVKTSDEVIAVSYPLQEKLSKYKNNVRVILSGHSFQLSASRNFQVPKNKLINVCYMGFLNNGIAIDWLKFILKSNEINLTIIGPIEIKDFKEYCNQFPNFRHIDRLIGSDLQMEMLKHDVMLMPYSSPIENIVTTVPAKLFQYLAVGKPIVSSTLENLMHLPQGFVYKSANKEMFLKNILESKSADTDILRESRIAYSELHTWDSRGNELFDILAN